jgi:hypothetical protein
MSSVSTIVSARRTHRLGLALPAQTWREALAFPLALFVFSRVLLVLLMHQATTLVPELHIRGNGSVLPEGDLLQAAGSWTRPWFRFDTAWFVGVAEHGYHWGTAGHASTNFLPVFPLLTRLVQPLAAGSTWLAAWLVANIAFLAALILLWQWARIHFSPEEAVRVLLLLTVFPFAFFYAAPYAESLFLALAVAAFLCAERGHWGPAITLAALTTVTRPVGVTVVIAVCLLAAERGGFRRVALAALAILPLLTFAAYLAIAFGHPLGFLISHSSGWVSPHGGIVTTLTTQFHTRFSPFDRVDAFLALVFLASGLVAWRRLGPAYGVFVTGGVLMPLTHGLVGMERYVIVLFPAFAVWATIRNKVLQITLFGLSVFGLVLATAMYGAGYTLI